MNYQELLTRTRNELDQWHVKQAHNPFDVYHLYYLPVTKEHDGGVMVCSEEPANKEYIKSVEISGFYSIDQHMIILQHRILPTLPVLS